jgi:hypothetical protein
MRIVAARAAAPASRRAAPATRTTSRLPAPPPDEAVPPSMTAEQEVAPPHTAEFASPLKDPAPLGPMAVPDSVIVSAPQPAPRESVLLPQIELDHSPPESPAEPASELAVEQAPAPIADDSTQESRAPAPAAAPPLRPAALPRPPVLSASPPSAPRLASTTAEKHLSRVPVLSAPAAERVAHAAPVAEQRAKAAPARTAQAPTQLAVDEAEPGSTPTQSTAADDVPAPPRLCASVANTQRERPREWSRPTPSPAPSPSGLTIQRLELQIVESRDNRAVAAPASPVPPPGSAWDLPDRRHQGMVR